MRFTALAALLFASPALATPSPEQPGPAMVLGCGAHVEGPLSIRDAETGTLLLTIPARDALNTDCGVTDAPMVFDGASHRAIILHR